MDLITKPVVAVVDDDPRVRESLESLIESEGMSTLCFDSAEQFLDSGARHQAVCLIADIRMPGMDGLELQRRVRLARPELPIIFITAHHDDELERRAFAEGAVYFIRKPFDAGELLRAARAALGKASKDNRKTS